MIPSIPSQRTIPMAALRQEIVGVDAEAPLLDGTSRPYVNLDNAASTPAFRSVQNVVNQALEWYSSVHRGSGFKSLLSTQLYDQSREIVAEFVGADLHRDCVIFGKNTSEAANKLANRFPFTAGDIVVTTMMEHHSDDLPWRAKARVVYADLLPDGSLDLDDLRRKLEMYGKRVKLVAVTGASNVTGYVNPVHEIAEMAHHAGAKIFVDCAQLAPHRAIDMHAGDPARHLDFIALSAHKMYAPFGTGALIGPKAFFEQGEPDYRGGGTIDLVSLDEVQWTEAPERDEAGSPNILGAVALAAAIRQLTELGMQNLAEHEQELTRYALERMRVLKGIRIYGSSDPDRLEDRLGVITFTVEGMSHGQVAAILSFEGGIGVRNGCFCAHPYVMRLLGIRPEEFQRYRAEVLNHDQSHRPGMVRASFGCYNNFDDIDRLVEMLEIILKGEYRGEYLLEKATGSYFPRHYHPDDLKRYINL